MASKIGALICLLALMLILREANASAAETGLPCPDKCTCHPSLLWDGRVVNCSFAGFRSIPNLTSYEGITELYLDHNNISHVEEAAFHACPQLKRLMLHHNAITSVEDLAFSDENVMTLETLDLSHNRLQSVPHYLPTTLRRLLLSYNRIDGFNFVPFVNQHFLEILYLDHNQVTSIRQKSFFSSHHVEGGDLSLMKRLKKLALNGNAISIIEDFSFKSLRALQRLTIANNQIEELTKGTFSGLSHLEYLDLRSNTISVIQEGAIGKMKSLKYLYLKNNKLSVLPKGLPLLEWFDISSNFITQVSEKEHKDDIYPLDILVIADNPLHCDCQMVWLKELFDRREHLYHFIAGKNSDMIPSCKTPPGVAGETWDLLGDDMFECIDGSGKQVAESTEIDLAALTNGLILPDSPNTDNRIYKHFMLTNITHTSALLTWRSKQYFKSNSVKIQFYIFEKRETFRSVVVSTSNQAYLLQNLEPAHSYIVCITPVDGHDSHYEGINLDQCTEFSTAPNNLIDWENVNIYLSYSFILFVKLAVAMTMACAIVGTVVVIAGIWSCSQEHFAQGEAKSKMCSDESVPRVQSRSRPKKKLKHS